MWANCLRYVTGEGVTVAEVARLARTTANLDGQGGDRDGVDAAREREMR
jgi:hypothetical protein